MNEKKNKPVYQKPIARSLQAPAAWGAGPEGTCFVGSFVGQPPGVCYTGATPNLSGSCHSGIQPVEGDWCVSGVIPGTGRCTTGTSA